MTPDDAAAAVVSGGPEFHADAVAYYAVAARGPELRPGAPGVWLATGHAAARMVLGGRSFGVPSAPPATSMLAALREGWLEMLAGEAHLTRRRAVVSALHDGERAVLDHARNLAARTVATTDGTLLDVVPAAVAFWNGLVAATFGIDPEVLAELLPHLKQAAGGVAGRAADAGATERSADIVVTTLTRARTGRPLVAVGCSGTAYAAAVANLIIDATPIAAAAAAYVASSGGTRSAHAEDVDECTRLDPVQVVVPRVALRATAVAGERVAPGERVLVLPGVANHHGGPGSVSLTFGYGAHACPGRRLALGAVAAFAAAVGDRYPHAALAGPVEWATLPVIRTPSRVLLTTERRA